VSLPPHLSHLQLAEEVEPRKPGESDSVYLLRLERMGLEPGGFFHGQAVLSKHREPPSEPPAPSDKVLQFPQPLPKK